MLQWSPYTTSHDLVGIECQNRSISETVDLRQVILVVRCLAMHGQSRVVRVQFVEHELRWVGSIPPDVPRQIARLPPTRRDHAMEQCRQGFGLAQPCGQDRDGLDDGRHTFASFGSVARSTRRGSQNFITALPTISPALSSSRYSLSWSNLKILRVWRILP